jgi:hypothetical protein
VKEHKHTKKVSLNDKQRTEIQHNVTSLMEWKRMGWDWMGSDRIDAHKKYNINYIMNKIHSLL